MRKFSARPTLTLRGRKFKGLRGWSGKPLHPPLTAAPIAAYVIGATFGGSLVYEFGFIVETSSYDSAWQISETDVMPGHVEPVDDEMSPADRLADIEVAVTSKTIDPLAERSPVVSPHTDDIDADAVRSASEVVRSHIWADWVAKFGPEEASRRWLEIFAATDAPRTG
jgi:hypothetical protein